MIVTNASRTLYGTLLSVLLTAVGAAPAEGATAMTERQREAAITLATRIAREPAVLSAVRGQNARQTPLEEIQKKDRIWIATNGVDSVMKTLMENGCARAAWEVQASHGEIAEIFVMDDQGAIVCMTGRTSDYWQGDEAKWQEAFAGGRGATFVDRPGFDESTGAYLVQVSVPVMSGARAIGAVTVGVNLKGLAARR